MWVAARRSSLADATSNARKLFTSVLSDNLNVLLFVIWTALAPSCCSSTATGAAAQRARTIYMSADSTSREHVQQARVDEELGRRPAAAAALAEHVRASAHTVPMGPAASMRSHVEAAVSCVGNGDSASQPTPPAVDARDGAPADAALAGADAATRDPDADGSGDEQDAAGQADVDAWLHDVLQRVQPGCEITVNALHMLGDLFETVCCFLVTASIQKLPLQLFHT